MNNFAFLQTIPKKMCSLSALRPLSQPIIRMSSDKVAETESCKTPTMTPSSEPLKGAAQFQKLGTWISYGFYEDSENKDRHAMHQTLFVCISLVVMGGGYLLTYLPDFKDYDWAAREGYLELRREQLGLPLIDPNFVDPSRFQLPTDEELGNREIII